jgi:hypothetical protein
MFCPNCKYEYLKGVNECPDCGAGLVEKLTETPEENNGEEVKAVMVFESSNHSDVLFLKSLLEENEIYCVIIPPIELRSADTSYQMFVSEIAEKKARELLDGI